MKAFTLNIEPKDGGLLLELAGEFTVYTLSIFQTRISDIFYRDVSTILLDTAQLSYMDSAAALVLNEFLCTLEEKNIAYTIQNMPKIFQDTLDLVRLKSSTIQHKPYVNTTPFLQILGKKTLHYCTEFLYFLTFLGEMFSVFFRTTMSPRTFRIKEIFFEMNESAIKALGIIALTSFLVGLVVAYQSAYQLQIYGANIFIVDMMGLSILRELAPMLTALVIAGRSGSAYTAQIGAMKITQEIDAMKTMGFDPFAFLVLPRVIALIITMPLLIFIADMAGMFGGILVAHLDLKISFDLFVQRFSEVVAAKHFFVGLIKGPFFAFLIASIAIHQGLRVKDDTQSIGFNTTKSVVESIFAVIVCDALFSIAFTNLGI